MLQDITCVDFDCDLAVASLLQAPSSKLHLVFYDKSLEAECTNVLTIYSTDILLHYQSSSLGLQIRQIVGGWCFSGCLEEGKDRDENRKGEGIDGRERSGMEKTQGRLVNLSIIT